MVAKTVREELADAIALARNELSHHVDPGDIDVSEVAATESFVGGYLPLLAGLYVE